jgi:hypothetical protein
VWLEPNKVGIYTVLVLLLFGVSASCCNQLTRHNIKQQDELNTINKHTAVFQVRLFVVVVIVVVVGFKR